MGKLIGTFPRAGEFDKAKAALDELRLPYEVLSPSPGFDAVGVPAIVVEAEARMDLLSRGDGQFVCSGWVDYRAATIAVPNTPPAAFDEDLFGPTAIMVLAPCMADANRIRLIAHLSGDLTGVMPYLNAEMRQGSFNADAAIFTFMDGYRMISLYARRIAVAKADELVDAWRSLEAIRCRVNDVWVRRSQIEPSYERRAKPPALEIYFRLPRSNCRACGQKTCMAFALNLWTGQARPSQCRPIFDGDHQRLRPALMQICAGLGVVEDMEDSA
jgi:ArsR family metal-binding transcriptional regulator